jgi:uncharacterized protein
MPATKEYSVIEKLSSLIFLQKIDSKLDEYATLKGELPIEVADLEDEIAGLNARVNRIEEEINGIQVFINEKKEAIKNSEELIKRYEGQSNDVKNSREFEAIQKELEMQQLEIKLCEKHIKDAMEDVGDKAVVLDKVKKDIAKKAENLKFKKSELEVIIGETEKEEKHFGDLRNDASSKVDSRLLMSYEKIRSNYRNGLAVVPVLRDACGGCYNAIPPQKQSEIKQRKKVMICENCGRVLVDEDLANSVELK